jgi:dTDP-N-acetylfucosamine:lipid II N-acetylfucosaminyltransferase
MMILFLNFSFSPVKLRRNIINSFYYTRNKKKSENKTKEAIQRINRIGHFIEYDFKEYIRPIAPQLEWVNWNYYSCEQETHIHVPTLKENQILLGNSASIYNNHLDAIEFLRTIISSEKLIVPLSYGGNDNYKNEVINVGRGYFGDNLIALDKFYSPNEYYHIIGTSKAAVFFNVRSQAAGNVLWCLMNNIPVFLLKDNPLFSFFNSNSIRVFSIYDDLEDFLKYSYGDFKFHSLEENIKNIDFLFGHHAMRKKYNDLLK